jgi:hypothetical protein
MRFYYTTGVKPGQVFEDTADCSDEPPRMLGNFKTFHEAEAVARHMLISEASQTIYLFLLWSSCDVAGLPVEFLGWRGRYRMVRVISSQPPRRFGTPCLFAATPTEVPVEQETTHACEEENREVPFFPPGSTSLSFDRGLIRSSSPAGNLFAVNALNIREAERVPGVDL